MANAVETASINILESFIKTYDTEMSFSSNTAVFDYGDDSDLQRAGNVVWETYDQHRPIVEGIDISGSSDVGYIEEAYPRVLGDPINVPLMLPVDKMRNEAAIDNATRAGAKRMAYRVNSDIATTIAQTGSVFNRYTGNSGYRAVAEVNALLANRQTAMDDLCFIFNEDDYVKYSDDLTQNGVRGKLPENVYVKGLISDDIAGARAFKSASIPQLAGGASPDTTVTALQSFAPEGGTVVSATGVVTNNDARQATIPVLDASGYNVGDRVQFENGGTPVYVIGKADKTATTTPFTASIVAISGNDVTIYPKPIAADDPALSDLEKAYANVDTQITAGAVMVRLNTDASNKPSVFYSKDSIEVFAGDVPWGKFEKGGNLVLTDTAANGQKFTLIHYTDVPKGEMGWRLFTWYQVINRRPDANGIMFSS